jgi:hypothetical protein
MTGIFANAPKSAREMEISTLGDHAEFVGK